MNENIPVIIVDDSPFIIISVRETLERHDIPVLSAESGFECLEILEQGARGVILLDVMMPEMNGWETIREIEKRGLLKGNIIVMLTALESPDEQMDGLQEYVFDYITKPFEPDELTASVKNYLNCIEEMNKGSQNA